MYELLGESAAVHAASRRSLLPVRPTFLLGVLVALGFSTGMVSAESADRPNVVLIMTDDQGYGDFGATGNRVIETPAIDQLARDSAWLKTCYVSPVCSPTRACLMTGRYNYRTRVIDTWLGRSMMEPDEVTVAEVLSQAGYATGIFGKWHLGDSYPMRPMDQGFSESLVHRGGGLAQPSEPRENRRRYTDPILFRNGEPVQTSGYCTDIYFDAARDFISASREAGRPFFVYLPTNAPHGPYHDVPEDLRAKYANEPDQLKTLMVNPPRNPARLEQEVDKLARIAAMITNVDQNVARLLDHLDRLNLSDNTMVIFLVDNGPNTRRYVGPFRGMKSEVYEGGVRSPLWIRWPARLTAGHSSEVPVAHIDLMPTLLDACGAELPTGLELDGRSLMPLLTGKRDTLGERSLAIQSHRGDRPVLYHHFMIRSGPWKLLNNSGFGRETLPGPPRFELYNIDEDPGETRNLVNEEAVVFARLKGEYEEWFDEVSSTRPDNYAPPRIQVGTPHENPTVLTRQDWRGGSWAPNAEGTWLLDIARDGTYQIRFLFDPAPHAEKARLKLGDRVEQTLEVGPGQDSIQFSNVRLDKGPAELHATLSRGRDSRGVYQVIVSRGEPRDPESDRP